jgi:hypothetical protein
MGEDRKYAGVTCTSPFYALRITQSCRAIACRDGDFIRFISIAPDHDAAYGKK